MSRTDRGRFGPRTYHYSLNEAANIREQFRHTGHEPECPRCSNLLKRLEGGDDGHLLELVACSYCGVSIVMELTIC